MRRAFDVTVALLALVMCAPLLAAIALAVWLGDFRTPFYCGRRVGLGGREFRMVKFRTMVPDAWKTGVNSTSVGDHRITRVGRWLRRWKLDELPQLINVLAGHMSLVGPRPQVPAEVALYTDEERKLLRVRPGVTDLASIVFADEGEILAGAGDPDAVYRERIRPWKGRIALLEQKHISRQDARNAKLLAGFASLREMFFVLHVLSLTALVSRRKALDGVAAILTGWGASPLLIRMARRQTPLLPYPPPGDSESMEDLLLGRPPVRVLEDEIRARIAGRVVLVTGAGGSIGSELCRQIAEYRPLALIGLDQAETALYHIDLEIREKFPELAFFPEIGNIQNRRRVDEIFREHRPRSVYHAAAYKHVPMMEGHLFEAIENNILGTRNVAQAAARSGVEEFVLISSDKAVRPASIMGATKRLAEMTCFASGGGRTRFMAVRFGNVLGSNGSVIPLFKRQIAAGGPITVTDPAMRRYLMTVREAAQLMLQAAAMGEGGEIFVLDMGPAVRIVDLARKMILLSGLEPDDIRIEFTGIRPGEKLCEDLHSTDEETAPTAHGQIRVVTGRGVVREELALGLEELRHYAETRDAEGALRCLMEMIPDFNPRRPVAQGRGVFA